MTMICQASDDRAPSRRTTEAAAAPSAATASANGVGWGRSGLNLGSKLTASLVATPRSSSDWPRNRRSQPRTGREQGGTDRVRVIDPSGQVRGREHDMGAAAAGAASASQPHPRPASIPAANGPWAGASPAPQPTTAPAPERARRKTPLRGRLVECADHLWLASRPSTLPDSGSSVNGAAGVALCRRHRVIAIRPTRQRILAGPRPHLRVGDRRST